VEIFVFVNGFMYELITDGQYTGPSVDYVGYWAVVGVCVDGMCLISGKGDRSGQLRVNPALFLVIYAVGDLADHIFNNPVGITLTFSSVILLAILHVILDLTLMADKMLFAATVPHVLFRPSCIELFCSLKAERGELMNSLTLSTLY
jgi:hypothetical protein